MTTRRQRLHAGTPPEPLAQRLLREMAEGLAAHVGCCPLHGTRLICAFCDVTWEASAGERLEVEALVERSLATQGVPWPTWPCGRCDTQESALCLDCYEPVKDQAFAGLTLAEEARLLTLCERTVRYTFLPAPDAVDDGDPSHEGAHNS
jgi:hypothetical protein